MIDVQQLFPIEMLPEMRAPEPEPIAAPPVVKVVAGKRAKQLSLNVRFYKVASGGGEYIVQAPNRSAAKYLAFKQAREIGMYRYVGGFIAFAWGGVSVTEVRR